MSTEAAGAVKPKYTLITLTHGGSIHHASGFESLRMCQEARSIALYGLTIEEKAAADRESERLAQQREDRLQAARDRAWRTAHPPRRPSLRERFDLFSRMTMRWQPFDAGLTELLSDGAGGHFSTRLTHATLGDDGLVCDHYEITGWSGSLYMPPPDPEPGEVRYAKCVIEMPDAP